MTACSTDKWERDRSDLREARKLRQRARAAGARAALLAAYHGVHKAPPSGPVVIGTPCLSTSDPEHDDASRYVDVAAHWQEGFARRMKVIRRVACEASAAQRATTESGARLRASATESSRYRAGARQAERDLADGCFAGTSRSPHRPYLVTRPDGSYEIDVDDRTGGRTAEWWAGYQARLSELHTPKRALAKAG